MEEIQSYPNYSSTKSYYAKYIAKDNLDYSLSAENILTQLLPTMGWFPPPIKLPHIFQRIIC